MRDCPNSKRYGPDWWCDISGKPCLRDGGYPCDGKANGAARQEINEAEQTPTNSDYAAALRVVDEWKISHDKLQRQVSFPAFCEKRLHSAKAPNDA
jgi:hypothetical protein